MLSRHGSLLAPRRSTVSLVRQLKIVARPALESDSFCLSQLKRAPLTYTMKQDLSSLCNTIFPSQASRSQEVFHHILNNHRHIDKMNPTQNNTLNCCFPFLMPTPAKHKVDETARSGLVFQAFNYFVQNNLYY